jgi:glucose/arabinose dehydrogenase
MRLTHIALVGAAAVAAPLPLSAQGCSSAGLTLPQGFCATLVADSLAAPRQMDVAPNGDLFVALRGRPARDSQARVPGGVMVMRFNGRQAVRAKFGDYSASTVKLVGNQVYTETGSAILRYNNWNPGQMSVTGPDTIVSGLPGDKSHTAKTFAIRGNDIFVNHGSPSNACQEADRSPGSKGKDPCPELATRAGIWRYDRNKLGQTLATGEHFVTGTRNVVAIAFNGDMLYGVQHGRDMLSNNWPALFTDAKSAENPAEEMFQLTRGSDFGWPYCYYDVDLKKKVLAPEYGGNGSTAGRCADKATNVGTFPGHWAPNSLMFYTGNMLPAKYRNGAFIVFHGSWNRAPLPNQGFKVVFQPMKDGRASGDFEVIVDGFMINGQPTPLGGRPMAIAQAPDGSLYLSDDARGRIWRITYGR